MSKNLYMHTINGRPAIFTIENDEPYIFYIQKWQRHNLSEVFVKSLSTIKRQQKLDAKWRAENNLTHDDDIYGYIRVKDDRDE